jgi:DNA-binding NarL/FixJ family response regulator
MGNLILASSNQDRLALWDSRLRNFVDPTLIIDRLINKRLDTLCDEVVGIKPEVLLLDFDLLGLDETNGAASLRRLCTETKIIILSGDISETMEWELLKAGVRGCCRNDIQPIFLKNVVFAVQRGELWFRRTLTCRLIDELGKTTSKNKAYRATLGLLNNLTQREYDIAVRIGNGENNKQIAESCGITERTVKAHLTEIYLKLGITDRLNLALTLSADNRNAAPNKDRKENADISHYLQLVGSRHNDKAIQ